MRLAGQQAVVIGGARGIGRALARALVEAGAETILTDPSPGVAEDFAQTLGQKGIRWDAAENAPDVGTPGLVVLAFDPAAPAPDALSDMAATFAAAVEQVVPLTEAQGGGALVAVLALPPAPDIWDEARVGWLSSATAALAARSAPTGVRVNAVIALVDDAPGLPSFMAARATAPPPAVPLAVLPGPRAIAAAALALCGDDAGAVTGQVLRLDGGRGCGLVS